MKHVSIGAYILIGGALSTAWAQGPTPTPPPSVRPPIVHFPRKPGVPPIPQPARRAEAARLPASITPNVTWVQCPQDAETLGAMCGNVPVPLDREHPNKGTININFELYLHSSSGPATSAILVNFGGPGPGTTPERSSAFYVFGTNLDTHDLLLIDDRGRGLSGTINCNELQHGIGPLDTEVADCATQLGIDASRYGTGDIAQDTDAVRAALGYQTVDYYGGSYGGADAIAYATRFGKYLRSIVLDAPYGPPAVDQFVWDSDRTGAEPRRVNLDCARSPLCSADHPYPLPELGALILTLRAHPVEGTAYDANGNLQSVRMDENALLNYLIDNPTGNFANTGEVLAAAQSLWNGDSTPILRLGAEGYFPLISDSGDPTLFSVGASFATQCADAQESWNWSDAVPQRQAQFAQAVSDLRWDYFAPFSKSVATGQPFNYYGAGCIEWQKLTPSSPIAEPDAKYPHTPTLVLNGDLDSRVPFAETTKVAALFPNSTFVPVAEAGHETVFWTHCAADLASSFIENLQTGNIDCTRTPETVWPAVGRFPLFARDARPAGVDPQGVNQIDIAERKVVSVAVATAVDAVQRSVIGNGVGVGLRAGTFETNYGNTAWTTTLTNCAFAKDVTVNGTVTWDVFSSFAANLSVSGPGTAGGVLQVVGTWQAPGPVGNFEVTGTLGGKQVAVLVPEA